MFQKLIMEILYILKQEHHTMLVQRFGEMNHMIVKVIYGH